MNNIKLLEKMIDVIHEQQGVEKHDLYVCSDCGAVNSYWHRLCLKCDLKQDAEVDEVQQDV